MYRHSGGGTRYHLSCSTLVVVISVPLGGCERYLLSTVVALSRKSAQRGTGTQRGDNLLREGGEGRILAPE